MKCLSLYSRKLLAPWKILDLSLPVTARLELSTPVVYLMGFNANDHANSPPGIICGLAHIALDRKVRIEDIQVKLSGVFTKTDIILPSNVLRRSRKVIDDDIVLVEDSISLFNNTYTDPVFFGTEMSVTFPFQFFVESGLPETVSTIYGGVRYEVQLEIHFEEETLFSVVTSTYSLDSVEVKLLRTTSFESSLVGDSMIVEGIWRSKFKYTFTTDNRIIRLNSTFKTGVTLKPICPEDYTIFAVRIILVQTITLNGHKTVEYCDRANWGKLTFQHSVLLMEKYCTADDVSEEGIFSERWCLPVKDKIVSKGRFHKVYQYTSHTSTSEDSPDLKITHLLKYSVLLKKDSAIQEPTHSTELVSTFGGSSSILSALSWMSSESPSMARESSQPSDKKIELTVNIPIFLLNEDSNQEIPPCYSNAKLEDHTRCSLENPDNCWFKLIHRWVADSPPVYHSSKPQYSGF